jgi:hypothetical protein
MSSGQPDEKTGRSRKRRAPGTRALFADLTSGLSTREIRRLVDRDAPRAYSVLMRDRERAPVALKGPKRWFHDARLLYSSISEKLSPARRLLFAIGVACGLLGILDLDFRVGDNGSSAEGSAPRGALVEIRDGAGVAAGAGGTSGSAAGAAAAREGAATSDGRGSGEDGAALVSTLTTGATLALEPGGAGSNGSTR